MEPQTKQLYHGSLGFNEWPQPKQVATSKQLSRPGYNSYTANEYVDTPQVLKEKIKLLAEVIKKSKNLVIYTGAGISRASGIGDYATKAKNSVSQQENQSLNRLNAVPSDAHYILTEMEKKGYIQHWLQQNHDGLAQKSGYPMKKLNQIHGSWFDKKNPVVLMDDSLKPKNFEMLKEWEEKVDICMALGTSLCGMRSDGIAQSASKKDGLVIINLQRTPYDDNCLLRIYGDLQSVMKLIAQQLKLKIPASRPLITNPYQWN